MIMLFTLKAILLEMLHLVRWKVEQVPVITLLMCVFPDAFKGYIFEYVEE